MMILNMFEREKIYVKPDTSEDALRIASENLESFKYVAGGTDILVNKFQGNVEADCLIDISGIYDLNTVFKTDEYLYIGSLMKLDKLQEYEPITKHFPGLIKAAAEVASPILRKSATIGGNLLCENRCTFYNQSEWWREAIGYCLKCDGEICIATGGKKACFSRFVSDTAPVLLSMDAKIMYEDFTSGYTIPLADIYSGDGINPVNLPPEALIKYILLPIDRNFVTVFKKLRPREAVDFTSLTTAVTADSLGRITIVVGGTDPKPIIVKGQLGGNYEDYIKQVLKKSRVVDNDYYSREYRRDMIKVFLEHSFDSIVK